MSLAQIGNRRPAGFTLLELMISVAIIGLLAAAAIPNFLHYQANSRRSEAFANVKAIANMETTYFGENDAYFTTLTGLPYPDPAAKPSGLLDTTKMAWDAASETAFSGLGWSPEGWVFYSYELVVDCNGQPAFTVSAFGDVDGDGIISAVQYGKPDNGGFLCSGSLYALWPLRPEEAIVNASLDAH